MMAFDNRPDARIVCRGERLSVARSQPEHGVIYSPHYFDVDYWLISHAAISTRLAFRFMKAIQPKRARFHREKRLEPVYYFTHTFAGIPPYHPGYIEQIQRLRARRKVHCVFELKSGQSPDAVCRYGISEDVDDNTANRFAEIRRTLLSPSFTSGSTRLRPKVRCCPINFTHIML